jgi:sugar O-acyltransferase (sialic acid O-acetyltransferase NeuD family)
MMKMISSNLRPVIVVGGGGHAAVIIAVLQKMSAKILGVTVAEDLGEKDVLGVPIIGNDDELNKFHPTEVIIANGIGMTRPGHSNRLEVSKKAREKGFQIARIIDPTAIISSNVEIGEGAQILAGAIIQPRTKIGQDSIVNTGAQIDHDCEIGASCHICPGAILAGGVSVGETAVIGAGSVILPSIRINEGILIKAGSVVSS